MRTPAPRPCSLRSALATRAGFTLAEVLLASVLGAMLLTALAVNTFGFTLNLDHLEEKAGVNENPDPDPILRRITKDVREAYWVEMPGTNHLKVASPSGDITEYWVDGPELKVKRPNGDQGTILTDFQTFTMDAAYTERKREGEPVDSDGVWSSISAPAGVPIALEVPVGGSVALGFVAPAVPADVPGQAAAEEQILSVQSSIFDVPLAFISGSGTEQVTVSLYESWAPGKAKPYQSALASSTINGTSLPAAEASGGSWLAPTAIAHLSLSEQLEPGVGYTLVLQATGSSQLLLSAVTLFPTTGLNEVALQPSSGGSWTSQPMVVPFDIKGPWQTTSTETESVISQVTMAVYPDSRPLLQRTATLLSQTVADDAWLGVVPGQDEP